jgi:uncharacterized protein (TIGR02453 family)
VAQVCNRRLYGPVQGARRRGGAAAGASRATMPTSTTFVGFTENTFRFLRTLARDNSREAFDALREAYDAHYVGVGRAFVQAVQPHLARLEPELTADPRVDGSIVRLHRDARFVGDGPPYKEQLEVWFWEGDRRTAASLLAMQVGAKEVRVGAGARSLRGDALASFRAALADPAARGELERLTRSLTRAGFGFGEPELEAVPRTLQDANLAPGSAAEALARRRSLFGSVCLDPSVARTSELVPRCVSVWRRLLPLHRWLVQHVQGAMT